MDVKRLLRLAVGQYRKKQMTWRLFLITFVLVESIILTLGFFYYRHSADTLLRAQTDYASQIIDKSNEYLQLNLRNVENVFRSVAGDVLVQEGNNEEINRWFTGNLLLNIPNAKNIHLLQGTDILASTSLYSWKLSEDSAFLAELNDLKQANFVYWLTPYFSSVSSYTVTAAMKIAANATDEPKFLTLDLDLAQLYQALYPNKRSSLQGDLLLLDRDNQPVFGDTPYIGFDVHQNRYVFERLSPELFATDWFTRQLVDHGKTLNMIRSVNNVLGWQVVWILDQTQLLKPLRNTASFNWLLALISLLLSLGIATLIVRLVGRPLRLIASSMNRFSLGELDTSIREEREDELGVLFRQFNQMTTRIRELIANLQRSEEKKKAADFLAFQAQIRPHFLYNTLNAIGISARQGQMSQVDQLISALTGQLEYSLDKAPKRITLREELKALDDYIQLMFIRYSEQFDVELDIDPSTLEHTLPKFVLQPLVENSIFHGLIPAKHPGTLFIGTIGGESEWRIMIEDDGVGIPEPRLRQMRQLLSHGPDDETDSGGKEADANSTGHSMHEPDASSMGLSNVHERLRLTYGEPYSMTVDSTQSMGTRIHIRLPIDSAERRKQL